MIQVYKLNIIRGLTELASYEFQKAAWFRNNHNLSSSFIEDVESVFDDTGLLKAYEENKTVFGTEADAALRDLYKEINILGFNSAEEDIIDSLQMELIRHKAAIALEIVKKSESKND